jgi:transcriptional/translational regulatory protein YebC/TACO1
MEIALEAGALDVIRNEDNSIDVLTAPDNFYTVKEAMAKAKLIPGQAEITMRATTNTALDLETAQKMLRLLDLLEELDDVQQVYSNADISDEIMTQLA